jgi:hypothetical protein
VFLPAVLAVRAVGNWVIAVIRNTPVIVTGKPRIPIGVAAVRRVPAIRRPELVAVVEIDAVVEVIAAEMDIAVNVRTSRLGGAG